MKRMIEIRPGALAHCRSMGRSLCLGALLAGISGCQMTPLDQVAESFEVEGRWEEALSAWSRWEPEIFCWNCWASMTGTREYHRGLCLERLGQPVEAKSHYWDGLAPLHRESSQCARRLLELHRATGTLAELREKLSNLPPESRGSGNYSWLISQLE